MAGTTANLHNDGETFKTGNDGIVIRSMLEDLRGGKTLDTTGYTPTTILEGHLVIEETASGALKPMPVSGSAYAALPGGHTYKGVVVASVRTSKPFVSVMVRGAVNHAASPYDISAILAAVRTALPLINFTKD